MSGEAHPLNFPPVHTGFEAGRALGLVWKRCSSGRFS